MRGWLLGHMPPDYSAHGWEVDRLIVDIHWLMAILFVLFGAYFVYALLRFRAGKNPSAQYAGMKSRWSLYVVAAVVVIELVDLFAYSIPAWARWAHPLDASARPMEVRLVGEQFAWNVHYPGPDGIFGRTDLTLVSTDNPLGLDPNDPRGKDDVVALNELHVEVNRPVLVHVASKDVIHSFKLPVMRVEQDAIPGMDIPIHFTAVRTNNGEDWEVACAQLCGLGHYRMRGILFVETKAEHEQWLASQAPPPTPESNPVPAAAPAATTTQ